MKRVIAIFIGVIFWSSNVNAQQDPMYTQFFSNKLAVNPAYAGTRDAISLLALYRHQWAGFKGAPKTVSFTGHGPIANKSMGLGASLVYDQIGIQRNYQLKFSYSYHIPTKIGRIALGVDAQINKRDMLWSKSNPLDLNDTDIPYGQNGKFLPNFGVGVYLFNKNYYVGISLPSVLENRLNYEEDGAQNGEAFYRRHYFAMAGVLIPIGREFALKPALLAKYEVKSPLEVDINLMAIFKEQFWIGATYRTNASFDILAQFHTKNGLRFGYSYDFSVTDLKRANSGSHEIMIGYDFNRKKKGIYNPRYF